MKKHIGTVVSCLFFFTWFACLTSQSLMDLADFLMFITGITILFMKSRSANSWKLFFPKSTGLGWLWAIWFLVVMAGLFLNNPIEKVTLEALYEFHWMLVFQVLCFTLAWIQWDDKKVKILLSILLTMTIVSFVIYFFAEDQRAGGPFNHSMPFAHTYAPAFFLVSGYMLIAMQQNAKLRWFSLLTAIATLVITVMSLARGVWIGMAVGMVCISILGNRRYGLIFTGFLAAVFSITLAFSPVARDKTFTTNTTSNESDNQRKALWLGNWEMIKDFPILGTGYSQNKKHLRNYYDKLGFPQNQFESHAHNQYLHFWAGTGTLGLICFLIFLISVLRMTLIAFLRLDPKQIILRGLTLGSFGAQICFSVGALTESNFSIAKNRYIFLLISAISVSIYYRYVAKNNFENYKSVPPAI